jgi:MFS family permease
VHHSAPSVSQHVRTLVAFAPLDKDWELKPTFGDASHYFSLDSEFCLCAAFSTLYQMIAIGYLRSNLLMGLGQGFMPLFPIIVADLTRGTGHFNLAQGAVITAQGIGAALSTSLAGFVVVHASYSAAFLVWHSGYTPSPATHSWSLRICPSRSS